MPGQSEILVCHGGNCRAAGAEAVLLEIEELAAAVSSQCKVRETGCLGMCSQSPSALVTLDDGARETRHMRLCTREASARVVTAATGCYPPLDRGSVNLRLQEARQKRSRDHAIAASKWNAALQMFSARAGRAGESGCASGGEAFEVEWQRAEILGKVGMWEAATDVPAMLEDQLWERQEAERGAMTFWSTLMRVIVEKVKCLLKQGRKEEVERTDQKITKQLGGGGGWKLGDSLRQAFQRAISAARQETGQQPLTSTTAIDNYSQWTLEGITPVSEHSAIFHLSSTDQRRGTPHPRDRGEVPQPITWHTTLLAFVGKNSEGPLPWVERDYTPISSSKDWERGLCDILIKLYPDGAATSWLRREFCQGTAAGPLLRRRRSETAGAGAPESEEPRRKRPRIWLSEPMKTLSVPSLADENTGMTSPFPLPPASVLLILAGTGVVALPQILAHRDPLRQLGIRTRASDQLHVPVDLLLSCRAGDVLMLPEIVQWCATSRRRRSDVRGLRRCVLLLTEVGGGSGEQQRGPFACAGDAEYDRESLQRELAKFCELPNCQLVKGRRVDSSIVSEAVAKMPRPCRVLVSGPDGFNRAVRSMLLDASVEEDSVTILTA